MDLLHWQASPDDDLPDRIAAALGTARDRIVDHEWVDNGAGWAVVPLATP